MNSLIKNYWLWVRTLMKRQELLRLKPVNRVSLVYSVRWQNNSICITASVVCTTDPGSPSQEFYLPCWRHEGWLPWFYLQRQWTSTHPFIGASPDGWEQSREDGKDCNSFAACTMFQLWTAEVYPTSLAQCRLLQPWNGVQQEVVWWRSACVRGAQIAKSNGKTALDRLDGIIPVVEDWHTEVLLCEVWLHRAGDSTKVKCPYCVQENTCILLSSADSAIDMFCRLCRFRFAYFFVTKMWTSQ